MKHEFRKEEELQSHAHSKEEQTSELLEFASVEEMIRHDANAAEPPAVIKERLIQSLNTEKSTRAPWWQRIGLRFK